MPDTLPSVLVLGLNYPPEATGISPYTGAMAQGLASRGFTTRVMTTHPHYPAWKIRSGYGQWSLHESTDGVDVNRLLHYVPRQPKGVRRAASEVSFGLRLWFTKWRRPDAIVAISPALISTLMGAIRARLTHRRVPFIVWVQDLYGLGMSETAQGTGLVVKLVMAGEGWLLRKADRVVVIHDRFALRVARDFGVSADRIEVIRNWNHLGPMPDADVATTRDRMGWRNNETVVLHTGNMGVKQGLENVIEAARLAAQREDPVRFVLVGAGSERDRLKALGIGIPTLQFVDPLNDADYAAALISADCLLVNELPGVAEMAVPSKLTSYFSAGRPIVAATDVDGITAEEVNSSGAGFVVPAGDPAALLDVVQLIASDPARSRRLGANGRIYAETILDENSAIEKLAAVLIRLTTHDNHISGDVNQTYAR